MIYVILLSQHSISSVISAHKLKRGGLNADWLAGVKAERVHLYRMATSITLCNPICQLTLRSCTMGYH